MADFRIYSLIDTNVKTKDLTGNNTVLIRNHSTAEIMIEQTGGYPISLDMCVIRNGSASRSGSDIELIEVGAEKKKVIVATFENVETGTFTLSSEDSEGNYITHNFGTDMIYYTNPTCKVDSVSIDTSGNAALRCSGSFFSDSFGAKGNNVIVEYKTRKNYGDWSGWSFMTVTKSGGAYAAYADVTGLDYEATYEFTFLVRDAITYAETYSGGVSAVPVFDWGKNDVVFHVPVDFLNRGMYGVTMNDVLRFDNNGRCYIYEPVDGKMTIHANTLDLESSDIRINGNAVAFAEYGTWTPDVAFAYDPSYSFQELYGWYTKVGNVVTVGFRVKVQSVYDGFPVMVTMLPFTPSVSAAGGGLCSGAKVSAGFNFQCFVAESGGYIGTRVQACNNTTDGALPTSAGGVNTIAGGIITLSGTITYMTN